mgnify:CR=1 FL=1
MCHESKHTAITITWGTIQRVCKECQTLILLLSHHTRNSTSLGTGGIELCSIHDASSLSLALVYEISYLIYIVIYGWGFVLKIMIRFWFFIFNGILHVLISIHNRTYRHILATVFLICCIVNHLHLMLEIKYIVKLTEQ